MLPLPGLEKAATLIYGLTAPIWLLVGTGRGGDSVHGGQPQTSAQSPASGVPSSGVRGLRMGVGCAGRKGRGSLPASPRGSAEAAHRLQRLKSSSNLAHCSFPSLSPSHAPDSRQGAQNAGRGSWECLWCIAVGGRQTAALGQDVGAAGPRQRPWGCA